MPSNASNASVNQGQVGRASLGSPGGKKEIFNMRRSQSMQAPRHANMAEESGTAQRQESNDPSESAAADVHSRRYSQPIALTYDKPTRSFLPVTAESTAQLDDEKQLSPADEQRNTRLAQARARRTDRTSKHIGQFLKIRVIVANDALSGFDITVDKTRSIEQLAHQIEAEYAFRNILSTLDKEDEVQHTFKPLEIGQLFDAGMLPLNFADIVGNVLCFNDTVNVVNCTYTESGPPSADTVDSGLTATNDTSPSNDTKAAITKYPSANRMSSASFASNNTLDDRFQALLHNKVGLFYFYQFCADEYGIENLLFWLDVETLQSCDPKDARDYAKLIYLLYIAPSSPLTLNIPPDVKKDIYDHFQSNETTAAIDQTIFDEAQENIYAILKGHSFVRFEKSPFSNIFAQYKRNDKTGYLDNRIGTSYGEQFPVMHSDVVELTKILNEPSSDFAAAQLSRLGDGKPVAVNSNQYKVIFLSWVVSKYFPNSKISLSAYYDNVLRDSWAQKQRKMQKEKKLAKFFGSRPSNDQIQKQMSTQRRISVGSVNSAAPMRMKVEDNSVENALESIMSDENLSTSASASPSMRRKKKEKLEQIFGDKISKKDQLVQSLVTGNDEVNLVYSYDNSEIESIADEALERLSTTNELGVEQKRLLQKRNKKISLILGQSLDEKTVKKIMESIVDQGLLEEDELEESPVSPTTFSQVEPGTQGNFSESSEDEDSLVTRKKQLDKLSSVLGERIKVNDISNAQSLPRSLSITNNIGRVLPSPRVLSSDERKQVQRRANKLEKIMGMLPPTEAIVPVASSSDNSNRRGSYLSIVSDEGMRLRRNITSMSNYFQCTTDIVDILETLVGVEAMDFFAEGQATGAAEQMPTPIIVESTDDAEKTENLTETMGSPAAKNSRQRRLNKLRKFFGNDLDVMRIVEQQLLSEIERTIETEVADKGELSLLKADVENLRMVIQRRSMDFRESAMSRQSFSAGERRPSAVEAGSSTRLQKPIVAVQTEEERRKSIGQRREVWEQ